MHDQHAVIASLRNAVAALPHDVALRLHLASLLLSAGYRDEAAGHLAAILQTDPGNAGALDLLLTAGPQGPGESPEPSPPTQRQPEPDRPNSGLPQADPGLPAPDGPPPPTPRTSASSPPSVPAQPTAFDWAKAEAELRDVLPPMFVTADGAAEARPDELPAAGPQADGPQADGPQADGPQADGPQADGPQADGGNDRRSDHDGSAGRPGKPGLRLADVAGLDEVKARLEAAFLAPMRNPELRRLYGKSLHGGLLLYGPPGCGKTFIARALAGELGAKFLTVSFADVVDMFVGSSERNISKLFQTARHSAPCVVFLDEVDAIGQKRSQLRSAPMRSAVNQLLLELDDVAGANEGVFVLAATNHPWDVDSALRRPGRLDRTLLVLPPDQTAREAVFRYHLRDRPVAGIQLSALAARTDGFSAADIAHACETAAELALLDSVRSGQARLICQDDLLAAVAQIRPSLGPWFDAARNVALFANEGGSYDELAAYLKKRKLL